MQGFFTIWYDEILSYHKKDYLQTIMIAALFAQSIGLVGRFVDTGTFPSSLSYSPSERLYLPSVEPLLAELFPPLLGLLFFLEFVLSIRWVGKIRPYFHAVSLSIFAGNAIHVLVDRFQYVRLPSLSEVDPALFLDIDLRGIYRPLGLVLNSTFSGFDNIQFAKDEL
jgi:hypothetical protein